MKYVKNAHCSELTFGMMMKKFQPKPVSELSAIKVVCGWVFFLP